MAGVKGKIWFVVTIIFAVCLTTFTLSNYITEPWHVLPTTYGDGMKNAFTYLFQSVYGKGFWFEGMNYPYGEHIVYTDGHPLLSVLFATCFKNVSVSTALTTIWWLIGLSYVLSVVYLYKILTHFKVAAPVAMVFAGLITVFSPQLFRITVHYGLSYVCVIPMLFYWTIKYNERSQWKYCISIFIFGMIASFLHPYFSALVMVWSLSYVAGYLIFTYQQWGVKVRHITPVLISGVCIVAFVAMMIKVTDPVKDRPVNPYGLFDNPVRSKEIVTSIHSPVWVYIKDHHIFNNFSSQIGDDSEGYSYLGIVIIIAVIFSFVKGIVNKLARNKTGMIVSKEGFSPVWLFIAFGILAFITFMPFIWRMDKLMDHISFIRQFRTIARFIWIFYYVIAVYGVVVIYTQYKKLVDKGRFFLGYAVLLMSICVWSYEASGFTKYIRGIAAHAPGQYDMFFSAKEQNWESFLREHHFSKKDFQAILMLSFFHVGSEKLCIGESGMRLTYSAKAAMQLHLPIIDMELARTSLSQTQKQVKIIAGPYAGKPLLQDIRSDKPFLLLRYDHDSLNPDERYLLEASDYIGHYSVCSIYACYPGRIRANDQKNADNVNNILPFMKNGDTCVSYKGEWYIDHLDGKNAEEHLFGLGAMPQMAGSDSIALIPVKPLRDSQEYEFSCWFLLSDKDYRSPGVNLRCLDSSGNVISTLDLFTKWSVDSHNMWFRASLFFYLRANCRAVSCRLINDPNPSYKIMDEILLRPADALIISKAGDGSVMVNNHLFKKAK